MERKDPTDLVIIWHLESLKTFAIYLCDIIGEIVLNSRFFGIQ